MQAGKDVWVTVQYRLYDADGEPIEEDERELTYLHGGYGAVFERIEQALEGGEVGYRTSLYLQPEDTFGDYDAELVTLAPRDAFPAQLERGMTFEGVPEGGADASGDGEPARERTIVTVTDFTDDTVVLDANHPLAGMALRFDLEITDLREATAEEIATEQRRP